MSVSLEILSGSTNGKFVEVAATATDGTTVHTVGSGLDEIWLWAYNSHTADVKLTLEWGGVTSTDDLIEKTIPFKQGLTLVAPGFLLGNSLHVGAFAGTANVIQIMGYAIRVGGDDDTASKVVLSGSTDGRPKEIAATSSAGDTIHTCAGSGRDMIWLYANNVTNANKIVTLEWGGTSAGADDMKMVIPNGDGPHLLVPGCVLENSLVVKAYCETTNVTNITGYINRFTP